MGLQKILKYMDKITVERGKECLLKECIVSYKDNTTFIEASVRERLNQVFKVKVYFDEAANIKNSECTCMLWNRCKHVAAVLIHHYAVKNELQFYSPVPGIEKTPVNDYFVIQYDKPINSLIKNQFCLIVDKYHPIEHRAEQEKSWKVIFKIEYYDNSIEPYWSISPVLQYIKKDGTGGSLYNFSETKNYSCTSVLQQTILNRLKESENNRDKLIYYIDYFLEDHEIVLLLFYKYNYHHVVFKQINHLVLDFELDSINGKELSFLPCWDIYYDQTNFISSRDYPFKVLKYSSDIYLVLENGMVVYKKNCPVLADFMKTFIQTISVLSPSEIHFIRDSVKELDISEIEVVFRIEAIRLSSQDPAPIIEIYDDMFNHINIRLVFNYSGKRCSVLNKNKLLIASQSDKETTAVKRNLEMENKIIIFLETLIKEDLKDFHNTEDVYRLYLSKSGFITKYGSRLMDNGYTVKMERDFKIKKQTGRVSIFVSRGIDWYDFQLMYTDENGDSNPINVDKEYFNSGLIKVQDELILLDPHDIKTISRLKDEGSGQDGSLKVPLLNLNLIDELYTEITSDDIVIKKYKDIYYKLNNVQAIKEYPLPSCFKAVLRNYQRLGYNWLFFLYENNINGCLADDMGLGKTIQTLAFLSYLKEINCLSPSLLVVPVTLAANWEDEINRYASDIRYLIHTGKDRKLDMEIILSYDLIVISYNTLRIDIDFFNTIRFNYMILDESQNIKNAFSRTFGAVQTISSSHRIALTGTPVENNTLELWSQMEFLNPGLLGSINSFKQRYAVPIEEMADQTAAARLRKTIYPFILRRKKEDVISDLPEKEVITLYTDMNILQAKAYEALSGQYRDRIKNMIKTKGLNQSRIELFGMLLRLRQMALFPVLANHEYANIESSKFELFKEMLSEILEENHKVLIFSQFVQVLNFIRAYLDQSNIAYSYIDGSTRLRGAEIKKFQDNENLKVFLLSLKAGGSGINLTAADYVILFDPWWNPAVEFQAIDRAHRIGQTRKVIGYKLIVKYTIEEKILLLQEKKTNLVTTVISEEKNIFKSMTDDDIIELFN